MPFYFVSSQDQYLYHYTKSETLFKKILPSHSLRLGSMSETNDPRESKDWLFGFGTNGDFGNLSDTEWMRLKQESTRMAKQHSKLICFTTDTEKAVGMGIDHIWERGFCMPRMWAQYAENHSGVCLILDRNEFRSCITQSCQKETDLFEDYVQYKNRSQAPSLTNNPFIIDYDLVKKTGTENAVQSHVRSFRKELFFEKSIDWSQEREFRWLMWDHVHKDYAVPLGNSLKGIVVGELFPEEQLREWKPLFKKPKIAVGRLNWKNGVPELIYC